MYQIDTDPAVFAQLAELPTEALLGYAEVLAVLELAPWNGDPINANNPTGAVRQLVFGPDGEGLVTYLILDDQQRVDVLRLTWAN